MKHRDDLPQPDGGLFLTDWGIETTQITHEGLDLPALAARLPNLNVLGGCCGTDHRRVREACEAWPTRSRG
jgi:hypothetical protein